MYSINYIMNNNKLEVTREQLKDMAIFLLKGDSNKEIVITDNFLDKVMNNVGIEFHSYSDAQLISVFDYLYEDDKDNESATTEYKKWCTIEFINSGNLNGYSFEKVSKVLDILNS